MAADEPTVVGIDEPPAATAPPKRRPGRPPKGAQGARPKTAPPPPADKRPPGRPPKPKLADKLAEQFGFIGMAVFGVGTARQDARLVYDGQVVMANAQRLAVALDKVGQDNPAIRRLLETLVTASAWGEVGGAVAAIAIPICANHGLLPRDAAMLFGTEPPASGNGAGEPWPPTGPDGFGNGAGKGPLP